MANSILIVVNDPVFFLSHRLAIALGAQARGYDVHIATAPGRATSIIENHGFTHHTIPLSRSGGNPLTELRAIAYLVQLFRRIQPNIVHLVTIKPVVYGGIAARIAHVPAVVAAVSGLGSVFVSTGFKAMVVRGIVARLYRLALAHQNIKAIFQNPDDQKTLTEHTQLLSKDTVIIRGSGVDLNAFPSTREPEGLPTVCFASRLLSEKGIFEFIEAAQLLNERNVDVALWLVGDRDPGNPSTVSEQDLRNWSNLPNLHILGFQDDIPGVFSRSNIIALPSYREGLPKTLIEAAAAGRAVVTTDVPGCRDAITPDETGLLVPVRDSEALADAIQDLLEHPEERKAMGNAGRKLAEEAFDINKVVDQHLQIYDELLANTTKQK